MIPLIGQVLLDRKSLAPDDLEEALACQEQQAPEKRIGALLVEMGRLSEADLGKALAEQWGLPYVEEIPASAVGGPGGGVQVVFTLTTAVSVAPACRWSFDSSTSAPAARGFSFNTWLNDSLASSQRARSSMPTW